MKISPVLLSALICLSAPSVFSQVVLLGNLPPTNDASFTTIAPEGGLQLAIIFTTGAEAYSVDSVTLRLSGFDAFDVPVVGFYTNAVTTHGSLVGSILENPVANDGSIGDFEFLANAEVNLEPNTTYWLVIGSSAGMFNWHGSGPTLLPTGEFAAITAVGSLDGGESYFAAGAIPSFEIAGAAVPEPSTYAACAGVAALAAASWHRRRRRNSAS